MSIINHNGKAPIASVFAIIIYSQLSLRKFCSGSTCSSTIWRNNIYIDRSQANNYIYVTTPNFPLKHDAYIIGTSQASIEGIALLLLNNTISIDPLISAKPHEPS
jgi:hypothetical protein